MMQVNKKFLEQQVKQYIQEQAAPGQLLPKSWIGQKEYDKRLDPQYLADKHQVDPKLAKAIGKFLWEIFTGSEISKDILGIGATETLKYGFGLQSYINSTINRFKSIDKVDAALLPFIEVLPALDQAGYVSLEWKEDVINGIYDLCDKHSKKMFPLLTNGETKGLAEAYKSFWEETKDLLEDTQVSNAEKWYSWALGKEKTSEEKFGQFFNQRQLSPTDQDALSYSEYMINRLKQSKESEENLSKFLEGLIIRNHNVLGIRGEKAKKLIDIQRLVSKREDSLPQLFGSLSHMKMLEQTLDPKSLFFATFDVLLSIASLYGIIASAGLGAAVIPTAEAGLKAWILRILANLGKWAAASNTLNITFYIAMLSSDNMIVLNRLGNLHKAYWDVVSNNEFRYADLYTIASFFDKGDEIMGGLEDLFYGSVMKLSPEEVIARRKKETEEEEASKDGVLDFRQWRIKVMTEEHKKQVISLILYGREWYKTIWFPKTSKGEWKELFSSFVGLEDGILGSYKKLYSNYLEAKKEWSSVAEEILTPDEYGLQSSQELNLIPFLGGKKQPFKDIMKGIEESYISRNKEETEKYLKNLQGLFNTIENAKRKTKKLESNNILAVRKQLEDQKEKTSPEKKQEYIDKAAEGLNNFPSRSNSTMIDTSGAQNAEDILKLLNRQQLQENTENNNNKQTNLDNQFIVKMRESGKPAVDVIKELEKLKNQNIKIQPLEASLGVDEDSRDFVEKINKFLTDNNMTLSEPEVVQATEEPTEEPPAKLVQKPTQPAAAPVSSVSPKSNQKRSPTLRDNFDMIGASLDPRVEKAYYDFGKKEFGFTRAQFDDHAAAISNIETGNWSHIKDREKYKAKYRNKYVYKNQFGYIGKYQLNGEWWYTCLLSRLRKDYGLENVIPEGDIGYGDPEKSRHKPPQWVKDQASKYGKRLSYKKFAEEIVKEENWQLQELLWAAMQADRPQATKGMTQREKSGYRAIAHNIGGPHADYWKKAKSDYLKTKDQRYLMKMWAMQDGNRFSAENFLRDSSNSVYGSNYKRLPRGNKEVKQDIYVREKYDYILANKGNPKYKNFLNGKTEQQIKDYLKKQAGKIFGVAINPFNKLEVYEEYWNRSTNNRNILDWYGTDGNPKGNLGNRLAGAAQEEPSPSVSPKALERADVYIIGDSTAYGMLANTPNLTKGQDHEPRIGIYDDKGEKYNWRELGWNNAIKKAKENSADGWDPHKKSSFSGHDAYGGLSTRDIANSVLKRLKDEPNYKPKTAIIHMGYNGAVERGEQETKNDFVKIINALKERGVNDIRIIEPRAEERGGSYYRSGELARKSIQGLDNDPAVKFISNLPQEQGGGARIKDGVHYTTSGYKKLVDDALAGSVSSQVALKPDQTDQTDKTQPAVEKPQETPVETPAASASSVKRLESVLKDIEEAETLREIIVDYNVNYGPSKSEVIGDVIEIENIYKRMMSPNLASYRNQKFEELKRNVHETYRETFRGIYNKEKVKDEQRANEIIAFLHRPRIIINLESDRMLFTNIDDFTLSFELGKPYGSQVGVVMERYSFFSPNRFGNSPDKQELKRIISQNKETIKAYRDKTRSLGPGMYGERDLGEEEKNIYIRYFTTLYNIFSMAEEALEPGGSMIRKAWHMDNFSRTLYLV